MIIRQAVIEEAKSIAEIQVQAWHEAYTGLVPQSYLDAIDVAKRTDAWKDGFTNPAHTVLLGVLAGKAIGFASFLGPCRDKDCAEDVGEIAAIYLLQEFHGRGFGQELFQRSISLLQAGGYAETVVWVLEGNTRARDFYLRQGLSLDGGKKDVAFGDVSLAELRYRKAS